MKAHKLQLRAPAFLGGGPVPAVIRSTDQRFIPSLLRDLKSEEGRAHLRTRQLPVADEEESPLYLPAHRCFNVVLAEVFCDEPGQPRVDPESLEASGVVLRRRRAVRVGRRATGAFKNPERWLSEHGRIVGWLPAGSVADELNEDPDAERRPKVMSGRAEIDRALAQRRDVALRGGEGPFDESFADLFVAPPEVCEALGTTLLYGLIDVADASVAEPARPRLSAMTVQSSAPPPPAHSREEVALLMPVWLRTRNQVPAVPADLRGKRFRANDAGSGNSHLLRVQVLNGEVWEDFDFVEPWRPVPGGDAAEVQQFMRMLWQVRVELQLFSGQASAQALLSTLQGVNVTLSSGQSMTLASFLEQASNVFVMLEEGTEVVFPEVWPAISNAVAAQVVEGARASLSHQLSRLTAGEGRFDEDGSRYEVRVFTRVEREDGCPAKLVWSDVTNPFRIAKWYEGGPDDAPKPLIELPALDRGLFKKLKPNVSVRVPRSMFNFLNNNDPESLLKGEAKNDTSGPAIAWICGFNISIIFIIAFMLLLTFVLMLNIAFWWMAFFRICIPLPASAGGDD